MIDSATPIPAAPTGITRCTTRKPSSVPVSAPDSVARQADRNRMWPGSDARNSNHAWVNRENEYRDVTDVRTAANRLAMTLSLPPRSTDAEDGSYRYSRCASSEKL